MDWYPRGNWANKLTMPLNADKRKRKNLETMNQYRESILSGSNAMQWSGKWFRSSQMTMLEARSSEMLAGWASVYAMHRIQIKLCGSNTVNTTAITHQTSHEVLSPFQQRKIHTTFKLQQMNRFSEILRSASWPYGLWNIKMPWKNNRNLFFLTDIFSLIVFSH